MKYVAVCKALYDYDARTSDEIDVHEDNVLYIIEKEDDDWWRAELKSGNGNGPVGLVPATYLEECEPIGKVRAEYDYDAQHEEELTFKEGQELFVLERDDPDWLLVRLASNGQIGLAPSNYVDTIANAAGGGIDHANARAVPNTPTATAEPVYEEEEEEVHQAAAPVPVPAPPPATHSLTPPQGGARSSPIASPAVTPVLSHTTGSRIEPSTEDEAQSWTVHEYDPAKKKKKKSKGNLLVGNGMICYGSETDKTLPVQQYPILDVTKYLFDGKNLHIEVSGDRSAVLDLQASSKSEAKAILVKITDSRTIAQIAATRLNAASNTGPSSPATATPAAYHQEQQHYQEEEEQPPAMPARPGQQQQRQPASPPACDPKWGLVQFAFEAESGEEVSVDENEQVLVVDHTRTDGWWRVEKTNGKQGLVPETYVELHDDQQHNDDDDNAAALEQQRLEEEERARREQEEAAARQRRADEERRRRDEEARRAAEEERRRVEEDERQRKVQQEAAQRAEAARQRQLQAEAEKRKSLQRTSTLPSRAPGAAGANGLNRSQSVAARQDLPKPEASKLRTWTDRSGAFKVEAQFLSLFEGKFRLHKANGVKIDVPVEKMSAEDVQWVERKLGRSLTGGTALAELAPEKTPPMPPRPQAQATASSSASPSAATRSSAAAGPSGSSSRAPVHEEHAQPVFAKKQQKKTNPNWDWFDWFMMIGVPMEDALKYSATFQSDKLDDSDLADLTHKRMKTLGVKENHVQRIERYLETEKPEPPSDDESEEVEQQRQASTDHMQNDEEMARRLHREMNGSDAPKTSTRSKPTPSNSAPKDVHPDLLEFIGTQFTSSPSTNNQSATAAESSSSKPKGDLIGFEDDAWAPRESTQPAKASPAKQPQAPLQPTAVAPPPAPAAPSPQQQPPQQQQQQQPEAVVQQHTPQQVPQQAQYQQPQLTQPQQQPLPQQQIQYRPTPPQQQNVSMPPRQRPVSMLKHTADPSLSRWQQQSNTGNQQQQSLQGQPTGGQLQGQMTGNNVGQMQMQPTGQMVYGQATGPTQQLQQQMYSQPTGQMQQQFVQPQQTQQYPMQTGQTMLSPPQYMQQQQQQQQPQQPQWQAQMLQPNMTGMQPIQQQQPNQGMMYQQPMATSTVPLASILPQPLQPSSQPSQQQAHMGYVGTQPTGVRNWVSATPDNPFGSPMDSPGPLSPQRTGVQFSTPNDNMFTQSPMQSQPTGFLQPQMTGVPSNQPDPLDRYSAFRSMSSQPQQQQQQPSIFTPAGSMAHGQSAFSNQQNRGW
ncbi:hypothetical protein BDB00DRAFT_826432 [Zychaea mexicana]|uniref:uncharacterized protein n=1 Tax=Zychaea mexicana TaxID=64656 RepID=UPI0022FE3963|nr:uncharacterized protein BDB00DRAFT_826432 [Zychaea mexicana]KAI9492787.1 hypothetical protein BDB00DRAFT_826432 [Zychaea mexicana]